MSRYVRLRAAVRTLEARLWASRVGTVPEWTPPSDVDAARWQAELDAAQAALREEVARRVAAARTN